eukprot:1178671-Prorocentrum_minimum.AAC.4
MVGSAVNRRSIEANGVRSSEAESTHPPRQSPPSLARWQTDRCRGLALQPVNRPTRRHQRIRATDCFHMITPPTKSSL